MENTPSLPNGSNIAFVEALYEQYLAQPESVPAAWQRYFANWERADSDAYASNGGTRHTGSGNGASTGSGNGLKRPPGSRPSFRPRSIFHPPLGASGTLAISEAEARQDRIDQMVRAYRVRGHMVAKLDPLGLPRTSPAELDLGFYQFTDADLDRPASSRTIKGPNVQTLREIVERLQSTYCRYIGVQFMHIDEFQVRNWLQERMEGSANRRPLSRTEQFRILTRLTDAVIFEEFIQKKFQGSKSFSLEGGESLIPLLDMAIEKAGAQGIDEIVIAMAHRGRLNVLSNIMGKSPRDIFREFRDRHEGLMGRGDVKYHKGYHCDWLTAAGHTVHMALCFNPSHLEFVNPVAMGRMRAKMDRLGDREQRNGMVIQIHGDAAFAGEGIVQETLQLSELPAYRTGGSLHVIVNNQIGFTTGPAQSRSSPYASDVAKMLQVPIFHVNGEDPESVSQVIDLALDFRAEFHRDVIIDMYCYRRRGHNESDEPSFTQPVMYQAIRKRPSVRESFLEQLAKMGDISLDAGEEIKQRLTEYLESQLEESERNPEPEPAHKRRPSVLGKIWSHYRGGADADSPDVDTQVPADRLSELLRKLNELPQDFSPHPTVKRLSQRRVDMAAGKIPLDWAAGEALALASLAVQGVRVRLTGQDAERGTFSHRHSVLHDNKTGETYAPFQHLSPEQGPVCIHNSPLSEAGVLGFEYGYAIAYPDGLVMWEAQFGDFVNAAQVIVDQFITSAEDKWQSLNGLVMLLPHGYEGQGPEHSSARIERFLQLAAEDNIQICNLTTPAQIFHCLRRQVLRPWRKPLVIFTPKSLLRHKQAISTLGDLSEGGFRRIIPDDSERMKSSGRVLMCSGKVYYDLLAHREETGRKDVAIVRLEQMYPLQDAHLSQALADAPTSAPVFWVQEEPRNMGAWSYLVQRYGDKLPSGHALDLVARPASASPATGSSYCHQIEQKNLMERAFKAPD